MVKGVYVDVIVDSSSEDFVDAKVAKLFYKVFFVLFFLFFCEFC